MYNRLNESQRELIDNMLSQFKLKLEDVKIGPDPLLDKGVCCPPYLFIIPNKECQNNIPINTGILLEDIEGEIIMEKEMRELKNGLITQKYTKVMKEAEYEYNAPHLFTVNNVETGEELCRIHMQEGSIKECGINGVANEDLIAMVIERLKCFQNSEFSCRENEMAIIKLEESLMWLRKRTMDREVRGVEGTSVV